MCYWGWYNSTFAHALNGFEVEPIIAKFGLGISLVLLALGRAYAEKYVSTLSYIEGLNSFEIVAHNFFGGKSVPRLVQLRDIISKPQVGKREYYALKMKGDILHTLLDQNKGTFVDKERLDMLIEHKGAPKSITGTANKKSEYIPRGRYRRH